MKPPPRLRNDFHLLNKSGLIILALLMLFFSCHKDNFRETKTNLNAFFNYSGKDTLLVKTIAQLKNLNDKKPFADSLANIGSFKWDAYIKSVSIDASLTTVMTIPYVNKQNILTGFIVVSITKGQINTKPVAYNYAKDYLNNKNLLQRFLMGNIFQLFQQKDIALNNSFSAMRATDKKQMTLLYDPKTNQQSIAKSDANSIRTLNAAVQCANTYYIEYLYYGGDNKTDIASGINNQYLAALSSAYANTGAQFLITSEGLIVTGPLTELDQISLGSLIQILETIQGVSSVISAQWLYGSCDGGGTSVGSDGLTDEQRAELAQLELSYKNEMTQQELSIYNHYCPTKI